MNRQYKSADFFSHLVKLRRAFHEEPELAFEEVKTAQKIIAELDQLQISYEYGGKGTGVVGKLLCNDANAPTIAIRADMDGLPGKETTGLPFASKHPGIMHACGHDGHMTMVLGAARLLKTSPPPGNVLFIFQPAEENGGGSREIIKSGALKNAQAIFAGHLSQHYHVGEIMIGDGIITAQSDRFTIKVHGKGGHGARPHEATDAIVITGLLISAIQTLISREVDPVHPSVITIGKIESGSAPNVIAEQATLEGSIRTTLPEVRQHLHNGLKRMANAFGELYNATIKVTIVPGYPPVINTDNETILARAAAEKVVGEKNIVEMENPSMGSEDFAYYLHEIPGCYVRFGARLCDTTFIPLHSPSFDINEKVLPVGSDFFDAVVRKAINDYANKKT